MSLQKRRSIKLRIVRVNAFNLAHTISIDLIISRTTHQAYNVTITIFNHKLTKNSLSLYFKNPISKAVKLNYRS